jgi:hypothetical protein
LSISQGAHSNANERSHWIDATNLASDKQLEHIARLLAACMCKQPKGYPDGVIAADARVILDAAFGRRKGSR